MCFYTVLQTVQQISRDRQTLVKLALWRKKTEFPPNRNPSFCIQSGFLRFVLYFYFIADGCIIISVTIFYFTCLASLSEFQIWLQFLFFLSLAWYLIVFV